MPAHDDEMSSYCAASLSAPATMHCHVVCNREKGSLVMMLRWNYRFLILLVGLILTSLATVVGISASQSTLITADRSVEHYWRTTYDILVRPAGSRSLIEEKHGLVAANHLSGIRGGISLRQYEVIKSIPGVEVAAPIAMVGYINWLGETRGFPLTEPGAYLLETAFRADDGITPVRQAELAYYFVSPKDALTVIADKYPPLYVNPPDELITTLFQTGILVAGIEPSQEAQLIGLDKAIIDG